MSIQFLIQLTNIIFAKLMSVVVEVINYVEIYLWNYFQ